MNKPDIQGLREELDDWRGRFDRLRVQANLGKKELRDKLHDLEQTLGPVHNRAKKQLAEIAEDGAGEVRVLARSLHAGWDELLRTHRELSRELDTETSERQKQRRS